MEEINWPSYLSGEADTKEDRIWEIVGTFPPDDIPDIIHILPPFSNEDIKLKFIRSLPQLGTIESNMLFEAVSSLDSRLGFGYYLPELKRLYMEQFRDAHLEAMNILKGLIDKEVNAAAKNT